MSPSVLTLFAFIFALNDLSLFIDLYILKIDLWRVTHCTAMISTHLNFIFFKLFYIEFNFLNISWLLGRWLYIIKFFIKLKHFLSIFLGIQFRFPIIVRISFSLAWFASLTDTYFLICWFEIERYWFWDIQINGYILVFIDNHRLLNTFWVGCIFNQNLFWWLIYFLRNWFKCLIQIILNIDLSFIIILFLILWRFII